MRAADGAASALRIAPLILAASAAAAPPVSTGTGIPLLHERPSSGIAICSGDETADAVRSLGTFRLCVLRVEFVEDFSDASSGDGLFETSHGTAYTADLADQMSAYMSDASSGRFDLLCEVFPSDGAFALPHQMAWYGADSVYPAGLCLLLRDAVEASDPAVDFSSFDGVMVIHAGAGQEADILGDSPDDIVSVFLGLADLAYYLPEGGSGYEGIETDDGVFVQEGMLAPEQETQDGYGLGVLGTMAHEFLHQLGLPDLYDTLTGGVGVGGWDMMGYGQWMMSGFWPTAPGAWSRSRLGWADEVLVPAGSSFECTPGDTVYKVRLSGSEYLLVENRVKDPDGDGMCGEHERDFGLHGSGILIWHIDRSVVDANLASNTVNADPEHKGVDLEEADGIQDFDYSLPDIYGIEGSRFDPYFAGGYSSVLGPWTEPSSCTSWGGFTGVEVAVQDPPSGQMSVAVQPGAMPEGWPVSVGPLDCGPVPFDTPQGRSVMLTSNAGILWSLPIADPVPTAFFEDLTMPPRAGGVEGAGPCLLVCTRGSVHLLGTTGEDLPGWPVSVAGTPVASLVSGEAGIVAVATDRDLLYLFSPDGQALPGWPRELQADAVDLAIIPDQDRPGILVLLASGETNAWRRDSTGLPGWPVEVQGGEPAGGVLSADFDRDGAQEVCVVCGSTFTSLELDGSIAPGTPVQLQGDPLGAPWLSDVNGDGYPEVATETTFGIEALEFTGSTILDWPLSPPLDPSQDEFSRWNCGAGGQGFAGYSLRDGRTGLADASGLEPQGFPVSTGADPVGRPLLEDLDGDGLLELVAADESGWAGLWQTPEQSGGYLPGADFSGQGCWWPGDLPSLQGYSGALAAGSFFVYPNPSRDGTATIRFEPGEDCAYSIAVLNVAGELVSSYSGSAQGGMACENGWDTSDISPGLYFICLEIEGPSGSTEALFQAGVVK